MERCVLSDHLPVRLLFGISRGHRAYAFGRPDAADGCGRRFGGASIDD
jgi:hypothetical protein